VLVLLIYFYYEYADNNILDQVPPDSAKILTDVTIVLNCVNHKQICWKHSKNQRQSSSRALNTDIAYNNVSDSILYMLLLILTVKVLVPFLFMTFIFF